MTYDEFKVGGQFVFEDCVYTVTKMYHEGFYKTVEFAPLIMGNYAMVDNSWLMNRCKPVDPIASLMSLIQ